MNFNSIWLLYNLFFSQIELKFIDLAKESLFFLNNYLIFAPSLKLDLKGMEQIIGRKKEIELLTEYYHSGKAELVAVYVLAGADSADKHGVQLDWLHSQTCFSRPVPTIGASL